MAAYPNSMVAQASKPALRGFDLGQPGTRETCSSANVAKILILYATTEGQTARIAASIGARLSAAGHGVEVRELRPGWPVPDPAAHDAFIVGASVHYGHHPAFLGRALRACRSALATRRSAFFSVSLSGNPDYAVAFLRQTGWEPQLAASFTGALKYSLYGWFKRRLVQAFARMGGHSTDTSRDHEYTDWQAVGRFADAFAARL